MKRSEFKASIKEEIIEILSEESAADIKAKASAQAELNKELEKTAELTNEDDSKERFTQKEIDDIIAQAVRAGAKEGPLRKLASLNIGRKKAIKDEKDDMHDDPGDIRIDHDYYTENLKEDDEMSDDEMDKKASKGAKKGDSVSK